MEQANDTAAVEQDTTTGEMETTETKDTSNDLSQVLDKLGSFEEKVNALEGRLNRQSKKETKEKSETPSKTNDSELNEKFESLSLQVAGITEADEIAKVRELQQETNLPIDKLLTSKYFKTELEDLRTAKQNAAASTGVKGDQSGGGNVKQSAEYWIAKGEYPTREQVSDNKVRAQIRKAFVEKENGTTGKFYNS